MPFLHAEVNPTFQASKEGRLRVPLFCIKHLPPLLRFPSSLMPHIIRGNLLASRGQFWEAHEAWEEAWIQLPLSQERIFLQLMIQSVACCVLLSQGKLLGFSRKQRQCFQKIQAFYCLGLKSVMPFKLDSIVRWHRYMSKIQHYPKTAIDAELRSVFVREVFERA